jgi:hypothetical protein
MWVAFRSGNDLDLRDPDPTQNNPASDKDWGTKRTLRAEVVSQILLHPPRVELGHANRFVVIGAHVSGQLDLGCGLVTAFLFDYCRFDEPINLNDASAEFVGFIHCFFPDLQANRLKCSGPVWLYHSESLGTIDLEDSLIQGEVDLTEVKLQGKDTAHCVCLCGANINGNVLIPQAVISGTVGFRGTEVNGSVFLSASEITGDPLAIDARLAKVTGDVSALGGFKSKGRLNM